ncbi:YveK family protein [Paenibacillus glycanilyticus]|uniref:Polysaccharide chain length determinant N-terminal domain-containing protein n=1 Tax=Paenibacillus glycanilyticus TaxID=126569 RepID=A0ABQ6G9J1_9BACL|nr:Wzz/FepE/Etk N-terminal domain-containing protein [Paenibacillus glycanilyticus]GLX66347.1 hypothetical protein MU1_06910 [Paenibacillus glycanilyticus]
MEIEKMDILEILKKRVRMLILFALISLLVSGGISYFALSPQYEGTTTLLVQPQNLGNSIDYNDVITNEKLISTYGEIIKSKKIALDVIQQLNLKMNVDHLLQSVQTEGVKNSLVTAISVTDSDPERAAMIANAFAQSFRNILPTIMKIENISILDEANTEYVQGTISPSPYFIMGVALALSICIGIGVALFLEMIDKTFKTEETVEQVLGLTVLGSISKYKSTASNSSINIKRTGSHNTKATEVIGG